MLWGALFVLAVLVRDAETAADAAAIDAIASTGMLYVLQKIMTEYQVRLRPLCHDHVLLQPLNSGGKAFGCIALFTSKVLCKCSSNVSCNICRRKARTQIT